MKLTLALIRQDLRLFACDRKALVLAYVIPIILASFMGSFMGGRGGKGEPGKVKVGLVDLDSSPLSEQVIAGLTAEPRLRAALTNLDAAEKQVRNGELPVAIVIPKGFGKEAPRSLFSGDHKPLIRVLHDPSRSIEAAMARGFLLQQSMQSVGKEMLAGKMGMEMAKDALKLLDGPVEDLDPGERAQRKMLEGVVEWMGRPEAGGPGKSNTSLFGASGLPMPFEIREEALTGRREAQFNGYAQSFAGMGVQFVLMTAIEMGTGILLDRQRGLWKRLRAAPLTRWNLILSKVISITLITSSTLALSFVFARWVFGVRIHGGVAALGLIILCIGLLASSLGLLLAALGQTPSATKALAVPVVLVMLMLSGAWIPSFIFPDWLQAPTKIMPTRWAIDGLNAMTWRGLGWPAALESCAVLLGFSLVFGWIAIRKFRWDGE